VDLACSGLLSMRGLLLALLLASAFAKIKDPHNVFCGKKDCYEVLELSSESTQAAIRKKFRDISLTLHPDKGGDADHFRVYQRAYDVLSDPEKREHYDSCVEDQDLYWEEYGASFEHPTLLKCCAVRHKGTLQGTTTALDMRQSQIGGSW